MSLFFKVDSPLPGGAGLRDGGEIERARGKYLEGAQMHHSPLNRPWIADMCAEGLYSQKQSFSVCFLVCLIDGR